MTKTITAAEAKTHLAECLRDAEQGEEVVITRYGKPVAALVGVAELERLRRLRAASPEDGLGGLVGKYSDGPELAEALDTIVGDRGEGRDLEVPAPPRK